MKKEIQAMIMEGRTALGIELGSTRIKAVLIGEDHTPIASGSHDWENKLEDGVWTYALDDVRAGLQDSYRKLAEDVKSQYGLTLAKVGAVGISAMMHGYLVFDADGRQLVPFRTWRNTITEQASDLLTERFGFNIPQRWSIAHLYQAMLNEEPHTHQIALMTTLAGYVHWQLTGRKVLGVGEASGVFPIDSAGNQYDGRMATDFDTLAAGLGYKWRLGDILPDVLDAGDEAGALTEAGAAFL
ncbi:MAG: ATPase, partial [Oscillospiraceae bacterium]|nr:ATPase [Oscillospiraceae bacterium]